MAGGTSEAATDPSEAARGADPPPGGGADEPANDQAGPFRADADGAPGTGKPSDGMASFGRRLSRNVPRTFLLRYFLLLLFVSAPFCYYFAKYGTDVTTDGVGEARIFWQWLAVGSAAGLSAMVGGFLSVLSRTGEKVSLVDELSGGYALELAAVCVVSAFVLLVLFISGLLTGDLFPSFAHVVDLESLHFTIPQWGKLMFWCLVAGFSERFVIDTLDTFISKRKEAAS